MLRLGPHGPDQQCCSMPASLRHVCILHQHACKLPCMTHAISNTSQQSLSAAHGRHRPLQHADSGTEAFTAGACACRPALEKHQDRRALVQRADARARLREVAFRLKHHLKLGAALLASLVHQQPPRLATADWGRPPDRYALIVASSVQGSAHIRDQTHCVGLEVTNPCPRGWRGDRLQPDHMTWRGHTLHDEN